MTVAAFTQSTRTRDRPFPELPTRCGALRGSGASDLRTEPLHSRQAQVLGTWCAADTLLFPAILGRPAQIESRCPTTDTVIRLAVDPPAGVTELTPDTAVISIPSSNRCEMVAAALDAHLPRGKLRPPGQRHISRAIS
jgi:hypothetical protein